MTRFDNFSSFLNWILEEDEDKVIRVLENKGFKFDDKIYQQKVLNQEGYSAIDIAGYIVEYSVDNGIKVTHIQLQKILYFLQAHYLVYENKPLFVEDIEMWQLGPVVKNVHSEYSKYGTFNISFPPTQYSFTTNNKGRVILRQDKEFKYSNIIKEEDKYIIEELTRRYVKYKRITLVDITRNHPMWVNNKERNLERFHDIYELDELKKMFSENENLFYPKTDNL